MFAFLKLLSTKFGYSVSGIVETWQSEPSFRQWALLVAASDIAAVALPMPGLARGAIFALGFLLLASELINTAVEAIVDKTTPERHPMAKKAKDAGSAMTFVTFLALASLWAGVLPGLF